VSNYIRALRKEMLQITGGSYVSLPATQVLGYPVGEARLSAADLQFLETVPSAPGP
jgi:hypothetical protein